jgi:hypothetical protein
MATTVTCDHCGQPIGTVLDPHIRVSVELRGRMELGPKGKSLKERALQAEADAKAALGFIGGHSYDLHKRCFQQHILPHLTAAGLDP